MSSIGITVGAVVVPQGMAYAELANLAPEYGLYSSFMGVLIYWFFATSKDITIGVSHQNSRLIFLPLKTNALESARCSDVNPRRKYHHQDPGGTPRARWADYCVSASNYLRCYRGRPWVSQTWIHRRLHPLACDHGIHDRICNQYHIWPSQNSPW